MTSATEKLYVWHYHEGGDYDEQAIADELNAALKNEVDE